MSSDSSDVHHPRDALSLLLTRRAGLDRICWIRSCILRRLRDSPLAMSAKAIREFHGKKLVSRWLSSYSADVKYDVEDRAMLINTEDSVDFDLLAAQNPWVLETKLVCKPDQLIKRRGKAGLIGINLTWDGVVEWIKARMNKECKVEIVSGVLDHFIVEPFTPHDQSEEYYLCIQVC